MSDIISPYQSVFLAGKLIQYNIFIDHEVFHFLRSCWIARSGECVMKLDMQKAYDRIEWNFLMRITERVGFNEQWRNWVCDCISLVTYSVVLNGRNSTTSQSTRGLRQGDPLSTYLFILVFDVLLSNIEHAVRQKNVEGIRLGRQGSDHIFLWMTPCSSLRQLNKMRTS